VYSGGMSVAQARARTLGLKTAKADELIREIDRGLPFRALQNFETASGVESAVIVSVMGIPDRTLARRKAAGRLSPEESERLLRISTIFDKTVDLFEGNVQSAVSWLTAPKKALGGESPLRYSRTEIGAREVENLIGRLEHGVFS
jgi:putative toxin-antitoxin system antitoxin component (TIGR02293 family)